MLRIKQKTIKKVIIKFSLELIFKLYIERIILKNFFIITGVSFSKYAILIASTKDVRRINYNYWINYRKNMRSLTHHIIITILFNSLPLKVC